MDSSVPPPYNQSANQQPPPGPGAAYYVPYPQSSSGYPPQGGYPPYNYPPYPQPSGSPQPAAPIQTQQPKQTTTTIVINATGNCPSCRIGNLHASYTMAGICCAIWFFPCGMIFCLMSKIIKCDHCGRVS